MQFYLETILKKFYFQNTNEIEIGGITFFHYDNYYFLDFR